MQEIKETEAVLDHERNVQKAQMGEVEKEEKLMEEEIAQLDKQIRL